MKWQYEPVSLVSPFHLAGLPQLPRFAVLVVQQFVGPLIIDDLLGLRVPVDPGFRGQRYICQQGKCRRAMTCLHVTVGLLSALDAVAEVPNVLDRQISVYLPAFVRLDPRVGLLELSAS